MRVTGMIEVHDLTKRYGSFHALNGISLSIGAGEIFGFLGVNGAGKTTTLKILAGILQPTSGAAFIGGFSLRDNPSKAKAITGFIPDRPHLYPKLTGREHLYFVADLYRVPTNDAEKRIDQLLEDYALREWQDELIESYSHGMKQRLATCGALVAKPKVLIVDEPMVGLDPHGAKLLKDSFRRYAAEGMSILLSTHSLNVAEEVSDRIAIIHRGSLIDAGTVDEIRHRRGLAGSGLEQMFLTLTAGAHE
jgi:ABC-2 type transport system ATP-binding protein